MKLFIAVGFFACVVLVATHEAHSYANHNQVRHGGSGGGDDHGHGGHGGGGSGYGAHGGGHGGGSGHGDYHSHPEYKFEYGVNDGHTKDLHDAWEHRDGDKVKGGYSLHEADGTKRVVEYTADKHNGFNAIVKRIGHATHPQHYTHGGGHAGAARSGHGGSGGNGGFGGGHYGSKGGGRHEWYGHH